jgi:DNA-directed RNA polymerase specialized sigma54-like protein
VARQFSTIPLILLIFTGILHGQRLKDIDHKLLVKKIILSRFLEMSLEKYENYIKSLKINSDFIKLCNWKYDRHNRGIIRIINFPGTTGNSRECIWPKNVLAEVMVRKNCYSINYRNEWFSKKIVVNQNRLNWFLENERLIGKKVSIKDLLIKIRLINIRNSITYKILRGIIYFQKDFFINRDDPYCLKVLSFLDVSKCVSDNFKNDLYVDCSRISRAINGKSIITKHGHEIELKELFPSSRDIKKNILKKSFT